LTYLISRNYSSRKAIAWNRK